MGSTVGTYAPWLGLLVDKVGGGVVFDLSLPDSCEHCVRMGPSHARCSTGSNVGRKKSSNALSLGYALVILAGEVDGHML